MIADDAIVLVRGRVDHKEAGKVCVIVQDVEKFDPTDAEIEKAKAQVARDGRRRRRRAPSAGRVDAAQLPATVIDDLRELFERYPGESEFVLEMHTAHRPAAAEVRPELPGRRPQRRPEGRARRAARRHDGAVRAGAA